MHRLVSAALTNNGKVQSQVQGGALEAPPLAQIFFNKPLFPVYKAFSSFCAFAISDVGADTLSSNISGSATGKVLFELDLSVFLYIKSLVVIE